MKFLKFFISFIILLLILSFCKFSFADNITLLLDSTTEFKENSVYNIKLSYNPEDTEENIYFLYGQFDYDNSVFEKLEDSNIQLLNDWFGLVFNKENNKFIIEGKNQLVTNKKEIMSITLKAKKNISAYNTKFKIKDIKIVGDSNVEENLEDCSLDITIKEEPDSLANILLPFAGTQSFIIYIFIFFILVIISFIIFKFYKKKRNFR